MNQVIDESCKVTKKIKPQRQLEPVTRHNYCDVRIEMPVFIHAEMNGYAMFIHIANVYGLGNK
jgi:hypothetical protein